MENDVSVKISVNTIEEIVRELYKALESMVPHNWDALLFSNKAHEVKNQHIQNILGMLPQEIVGNTKIEDSSY